MDRHATLEDFKKRCAAEGLLPSADVSNGDDVQTGVNDDGTLLRFLRARGYNVDEAFKQYKKTREWRQKNQLVELYETIDIEDYEETRKLYTHWTGRRDRRGIPVFLFDIGQLTPSVMAAYDKSCSSRPHQTTSTESEPMLRLFCTYENLTRFVFPLCSALQPQGDSHTGVTTTTCIIDISGVGLMQFWRLKNHMQAASALATAHYPETLGQTYIIGAPSFFHTIWGWISTWFDQNTMSKIRIVPRGQELSILSEVIDPANIPRRYGGQFNFEFGMAPALDAETTDRLEWLDKTDGAVKEIPMGPVRWVTTDAGRMTAVAVGTIDGTPRLSPTMAL